MDRLSELPDELLIRILSFMPTLDPVRTMLLPRFGKLWTLVSNLEFESFDFHEPQRFMLFVHNVLILHQAPVIHTFTLKFGYNFYGEDDEDVVNDIYLLIKCGLNKQPKIVNLHTQAYFPLPPFLFINQSIEYLSLFRCELNFPNGAHMGSLRSLVLSNVAIDMASFKDMMSCCPSLETLTMTATNPSLMIFVNERIPKLVLLEGNEYYFVSCPKAKILNLYCHSPSWLEVVDFSSICEANIRFKTTTYRPVEDDEDNETMGFLKTLNNAEVLTFEGLALTDKTFSLNRWRVVTLKKTNCRVPCVVWICNLLRNSPFLEKLTLNAADGIFKYVEWKGNHIYPELSSTCVASRLSEVYIYIREERDHLVLLQMVELFLKSAVELSELVIYFKGTESRMSTKIDDLLRTFSGFTRTSSNAVITIYWESTLVHQWKF